MEVMFLCAGEMEMEREKWDVETGVGETIDCESQQVEGYGVGNRNSRTK